MERWKLKCLWTVFSDSLHYKTKISLSTTVKVNAIPELTVTFLIYFSNISPNLLNNNYELAGLRFTFHVKIYFNNITLQCPQKTLPP